MTKIENDNLFKFSPYKNLTDDQFLIANHILSQLSTDIQNNKESTFIVNGGPGTGKTVLAIYLMKLLSTKTIDEYCDKMIIGTPDRIWNVKRDAEKYLKEKFFSYNEPTKEKIDVIKDKLNIDMSYLLK